MVGARDAALDDGAIGRLLDAVCARYGYDFRRYAATSLRRRLGHALEQSGLTSLAELERLVLADRTSFERLVEALTIQVTEMFRDPPFYAAFRREVVPYLRTYPRLKLWVAGCAGGEEAHSLAILLHEEGLAARAVIHATDLSPAALARARAGIYPVERIRQYADNYRRAGGTASLPGYFTIAHGHAALDRSLLVNLHVAEHNLVSDEVFGEMHAVLCRNVLIYFDRSLQDDAVSLLVRSLAGGGFLCLGAKETLHMTRHADAFAELSPGSKIYRRRMPWA